MKTVPTSSIQIIWLAAVTKSILFVQGLLKRQRLLHKCCDTYKSKNQGEFDGKGLYRSKLYHSFLTIKMVPIGSGANDLELELFLYLVLFLEAWCAWYGVLFYLLLWL